MNILFFSFVMTELQYKDIIESDANMPSQTHKFGKGVLEILANSFENVDVISFMPVSNFPRNKKIFFGSERGIVYNKKVLSLPFVNLFLIKHWTRLFSVFYFGLKFLRKNKDQAIVIHGVHSPYLVFAFICKCIFGKDIFVIVTDPPSQIYSYEGLLTRVVKRVDRFLVKKILKSFKGIALTENIGRDYFPNKNVLLIDGILNSPPVESRSCDSNKIYIVYAGLLEEDYGVSDLINAMKYIKDDRYILKLFGRGSLNLDEISFENKNIKYFGVVDFNDLSHHYSTASILINPRRLSLGLNKYSFPSKLIEYLSTGVPVLTTRLPAISSDLEEYFNYLDSTDPETIAQKLIDLSTDPTRLKRASLAKDYVLATRTPKAYEKKFKSFIEGM
ncbi:glycosyltransferase [Vibrio parahaemolyticus]|nr:glycosyltransferase [Vibrio parahaemolyticus]EJG1675978.1 glycosyltransferase [Vibrio parahaemolyticus]EJG1719002.1 glycosyltransferase [Vibrio parahaemolyticus]EJG1760377.1 glycosyltransferase [Vibrio parahaemolyticus]ELB2015444.1 glycosyltransferase [Vibrio parahaemolyticus]